MKQITRIFLLIAAAAALLASQACNDRKSYAQLLGDENICVNAFLANQRVIGYEQRDSTFEFEYGPNAPYYQLDEDGVVYMQVINPGTKGYRAKVDQLIYFRFTRWRIQGADGSLGEGSGNDSNIASGDAFFRYSNMSANSSYEWGSGVQMPLVFLPIDCEVNVIIKSQYGPYSEVANVIPFLYNIRYFKSQI